LNGTERNAMYVPAHFREERTDVLLALMRAAPLCSLVIATEQGLEANLLPLQLREAVPGAGETGLVLVGHVARANPIWKKAARGEALAIFSGPQAYISPSGFASKQEHGKVVPTWNYVAVHAHGPIRWIEDDAWLAAFLEALTNEHEAGRAEPWRVSDAPPDFTAATRRGVVGLEMPVTRLEGKRKLSQNRSLADRQSVIAELRQRGDEASNALAEAMQAALDE
jgi:transcriptional regulator